MPLTGMNIVIAGRLKGQTQEELATQLTARGALVRNNITKTSDLVIVGSQPGKSIEKAQTLGIELLQESELPRFLARPTQALHNTTSPEEKLAELRGLLNRPPTEANWQLLCLLFDAWPEESLEISIAYAHQHLQSWPSEVCVSPKHWLEEAREGSANPRMAVVRTLLASSDILDFPPHNSKGITQIRAPMLGDSGLITLIQSGYIKQVEHIKLPAQNITDVGVEALAACEGLEELHTLELEGNAYTMASMPALCAASFVPQLEQLSLQSHGLTREQTEKLRKEPDFNHIKTLKLTKSIQRSSWEGFDSDGDTFEYFFCEDGHIQYTEEGDMWNEQSDQWRQLGSAFVLSMTNAYGTYTGTITDDKIKGASINVTGRSWTWEWTYLPDGPVVLEIDGSLALE